ncbi:MAG: oxidoreductase [candidate division WOR-3 bacterium]
MKKKFAFYWAASCGGCEIAVLDINEKILDVIKNADILFWPVAIDTKYRDVENLPDEYFDFCFFNGSIRNSEQEHLAKLLRKKSKVLVAFGSCAVEGCIPGLANLYRKEDILKRGFIETESTDNPKKVLPQKEISYNSEKMELPEFYSQVFPLDEICEVDYYLPGCPPPTGLIINAMEKIFANENIPKKTYLAPTKSLCDTCERNKTFPKKMPKIKRMIEIQPDPNTCFLEQGIICLGPATRSGCKNLCINANWPCTGCMGPTPEVSDQGAKMISALASILLLDEEKKNYEEFYKILEEEINKIKDPIGSFYMYSLAKAILNKRRGE